MGECGSFGAVVECLFWSFGKCARILSVLLKKKLSVSCSVGVSGGVISSVVNRLGLPAVSICCAVVRLGGTGRPPRGEALGRLKLIV